MPEVVPPKNIGQKQKLKPTPKAGFRMPKLKEGEEIIGFRPGGHTSLTG